LPSPPDAAPSVDMQVNLLTLRFRDEQEALEEPFWSDYFQKHLLHLRLCHFYAVFFIAVAGVLDGRFFPDQKHLLWFIRYGVVVSVFVVGLALTFTRYYRRCWQLLEILYVLVAGGGFIAMIAVAPPPGGYSYYVGVLIALVFGYAFIRQRFIYATLAGWAIILAYLWVSTQIVPTPRNILYHHTLYLLVANFLGMLIAYSVEYSARRDFFLAQLLKAEQGKVEKINRELEKRVEQRTAQIRRAHEQLKREMQAHLQLERDKRKLEAQLQRARKMEAIGTLAGGVAHDLNNILSGVVSYPDLLLMDLPEDSFLRKPLLTMKRSGEKAAAIVQDLLTLARRGVAVSETIDLNRIVADYLNSPEFAKLQQYHPEARICTRISPEPVLLTGSPVHLSKCLMNLVSNAVEAMPEGGTVTICTAMRHVPAPIITNTDVANIVPGDYACLTVSDTGTGISPGDLERIFEPFYTKKTMGRSGTGLGMAVVWGTVKDHKGYIDIQTSEGQGSTFTLFFPASHAIPRVAPRTKPPLEALSGNGQTILVVDDVPEQREIASSLLEKLGYRVETAESGEAAVRYLQSHEVDLVILDMIMNPGIDGLETYRRILKIHPHQRAIIASGYSETKRIHELQRLGGGVCIRKPYTLETIGRAVKEELAKPSGLLKN